MKASTENQFWHLENLPKFQTRSQAMFSLSTNYKYVLLGSFVVFFCMFGLCFGNDKKDAVSNHVDPSLLWCSSHMSSKNSIQTKRWATGGNVDLKLPALGPGKTKLHAITQFLVPTKDLNLQLWTVDILSFMGVPILTASLRRAFDGSRVIEITTRGEPAHHLVSITSGLEFHGENHVRLGNLDQGGDKEGQCTFREKNGRPVMMIYVNSGGYRFKMTSVQERVVATVVQRSAGAVQCEHLELTAEPGVDTVLMLACALTQIAFGPPDDGTEVPCQQADTESESTS